MPTTHIPMIPPKNRDSFLRFVRSDPGNLKKLFNLDELPEPLTKPPRGFGGGEIAPASPLW